MSSPHMASGEILVILGQKSPQLLETIMYAVDILCHWLLSAPDRELSLSLYDQNITWLNLLPEWTIHSC